MRVKHIYHAEGGLFVMCCVQHMILAFVACYEQQMRVWQLCVVCSR